MSFSVLAAAREHPSRDALIVDGEAWSYRLVAERTRGLIDELRERAAAAKQNGPREHAPRVALLARPEPESILRLFALVELGWPAIPLHPRATPEERSALLHAAGATFALDDPSPAAAGPITLSEPTPRLAQSIKLAALGSPLPDDDRWLAILATSGSTGPARAVALSRAAFAFAARASEANLGFTEGDRWLLALPFAHVGGLSVLLRCLRARRTIALRTKGESPASSAAALAETIARDRITLLSLVPTQLHRLLELDPPFQPPPFLRAILLGGAAAPPALLARADERGLPVLATYGMTETCAQVATERPGARHTEGRSAVQSGAPPLPGVEVRILEGAIAIRAPSLLAGYLEAGSLRSPLDAEGFLRTRDAGFLDERGHLHVLGRIDDVIVTGGEKVHPLEVEAVLAHLTSAACVFGVADAEWGAVVAAALVPRSPDGPASDEELRTALAALASFKRPRRIAWLDALPLGASGKVDRRAVANVATPLLRAL